MDRINWVTSECFNAILQLARSSGTDRVPPDLVHSRMRSFFDALSRRAREAGYSEQDSKLVLYAIAALADEVMMAKGGPLRDYWSTQPMQLLLFGENVAGERFFEHLEAARARGASDVDVLRTYYSCLLFGFRGRYAVRGAEVALDDLIESVRVQLARALPNPDILSPNGARPEEGILDATRHLPIVALASAILALSVVLYLGLAVSLREHREQFVGWMNHVTGG